MSFLTLEKLSKVYGDFAAARDIDLSVAKGEFVSLLGPSGCGKTTTLQMIAGLVEPTTGTITLDGRDITRETPNKRGLGIVFQSYALFPHMTVAQNVAFGLEMRKVAKAERDERVASMLGLVHLAPLAERYPRQLSGGQRQRVAIARALVIQPPVLLLDEPLSNLDAKLREEMQFELRRIQQRVGTTTIMVTHDQAEALSISDRVVVMEQGRMTQVDAPYRLYENPATPFISTFVGKMNRLEGVWRKGAAEICRHRPAKRRLAASSRRPGRSRSRSARRRSR
jgi:putative spermidine/putrescine transport system ATP-binding protein